MSAAWGSRSILGVSSTGVATQLYPTTMPATASTATYPPAGGGYVRRPTEGRTEKIAIAPDGINGGLVEIWDVAGLDRGASNNVNDGVTMTNAYLVANGKLIWSTRITGSADHGSELAFAIHHLTFEKGLAVRFVSGAGAIDVAPFVEAGFMLSYVAG